MVNRIVEVPIDLDDINEDDLVEYLEDRGYLVEKEDLSSDVVIVLLILAIMVRLKVS